MATTDPAAAFAALDQLLGDPTVTDLLINGPRCVQVRRAGVLETPDLGLVDDAQVEAVAREVARRAGCPLSGGRLCGDGVWPAGAWRGAQVSVVLPPIARDSAVVVIRKAPGEPLTARQLVLYGSLTHEAVEFLEAAVAQRRNIVVVGGFSSGKTTLLNVVCAMVPPERQVVTIEGPTQLAVNHPQRIPLVVLPPGPDGQGGVSPSFLLGLAGRLGPDVTVLSELHGPEALDLLLLEQRGGWSWLAGAHATSPLDFLRRLETMIALGDRPAPKEVLTKLIDASLDLIVSIQLQADGTRRVTHITEPAGVRDGRLAVQDLFAWDAEAKVLARTPAAPRHPGVARNRRARDQLPRPRSRAWSCNAIRTSRSSARTRRVGGRAW